MDKKTKPNWNIGPSFWANIVNIAITALAGLLKNIKSLKGR